MQDGRRCSLVEESESHVIVLLFRLFLLLLLGGSCGGVGTAGTSGGSRGSGAATGRDGSQLLAALSHQLLDVLAGELLDDLVELVVFNIDSDGGDDSLDVSGLGALVAAQNGQKVSSHVTHG